MKTYDLIIRNGKIVSTDAIIVGDIAIKDGKIVAIGQDLTGEALEVIHADGLYVLPGLIDSHVHLNEPGRTDWEGFETGSRALAASGVTSFIDMPLNSTPPTVNKENLELKRSLAEEKSIINAYFWGGLVPENIENLQELKENGVLAFKAFIVPSGIDDFNGSDDATILKGMKEIASLESFLGVHAERAAICEFLTEQKRAEGKTTARDFVESRPIISEVEAVRRLISFAELTGCKLHIVHASSRKVVEEVNKAKERGLDITVETCPHYLSLTVKDLEEQGALAKCTPPLRDQEEVDDLWTALENDEIDVISSDHSPAPASMKQLPDGNYFEGWGGISGAQSTLSVMLTEGYHKRNIPLEKIVSLTSTNPAKLFGLYPQKGVLSPGSDADITIVDVNESYILNKEDLFYRHQHSPYVGKSFKGKVKTTIVKGKVVFDNGKILPDQTVVLV